jgi:CheY-like chemotaxis protein
VSNAARFSGMYGSQFGSGRTVLLVDDSEDLCVAVQQLLETLGFRVVCAANGAEALEKLKAESIAVILLDLFMPVMDGVELLRRLQPFEQPVPPIVAMTGDEHVAADSMGRAAALLGANAVLMKPFSRDQLAGAIAFASAGERRHSSRPTG